MIPALAFLLHPHVWKRVSRILQKNNNNDQQLEENTFYIPPEDDDIEEGVNITDKYGSINSYSSCVLSPKQNRNCVIM